MKDMMMQIYNSLLTNSTISTEVGKDRIKFYELVETFDTTKPFIIIDVLGPQENAYFIANNPASIKVTYQINIETNSRMLTKEIAKAVQDTMRENNFGQLTGGLDTYFKETKRFVDARRYRKNTQIHDTDY